MRTFAFSDLNRQSGEVLDAALAEPVTLEKHGKPKIVMMSVEAYERMQLMPRAYALEELPAEFRDELLEGLNDIIARR